LLRYLGNYEKSCQNLQRAVALYRRSYSNNLYFMTYDTAMGMVLIGRPLKAIFYSHLSA
jgi:hypothetical protein